MTALSQVQSIDLSNNGFQGPLPPLANQSSLQNLNFHDNQLTGMFIGFLPLGISHIFLA